MEKKEFDILLEKREQEYKETRKQHLKQSGLFVRFLMLFDTGPTEYEKMMSKMYVLINMPPAKIKHLYIADLHHKMMNGLMIKLNYQEGMTPIQVRRLREDIAWHNTCMGNHIFISENYENYKPTLELYDAENAQKSTAGTEDKD